MGRGRSPVGGGGNLKPSDIKNVSDLWNFKDSNPYEVSAVAKVSQDLQQKYGVTTVSQMQVAELKGGHAKTMMAYYDGSNVAINQNYFDLDGMNNAYKMCVEKGFHPSAGNKSGLEAVAAHEFGHMLTDKIAQQMGVSDLHSAANLIVNQAKQHGYTNSSSISGYAKHNSAETIAEAFSDVYCNGNKAHPSSQAIVKVMDGYLLNK